MATLILTLLVVELIGAAYALVYKDEAPAHKIISVVFGSAAGASAYWLYAISGLFD